MFTISILLMAGTIALATTSTGRDANFGTTSINNNNEVTQKQEQPLQLIQSK